MPSRKFGIKCNTLSCFFPYEKWTKVFVAVSLCQPVCILTRSFNRIHHWRTLYERKQHSIVFCDVCGVNPQTPFENRSILWVVASGENLQTLWNTEYSSWLVIRDSLLIRQMFFVQRYACLSTESEEVRSNNVNSRCEPTGPEAVYSYLCENL